jgi:MGT family glycosyltransferase
MSTFLYYLTPQTGHVFPLVPTWQELMRRGHRVAVRCPPQHVELLTDLGVRAAPIAPAIIAREQDDWRARSPIGALRRSMRTFLDRAVLEVEDLRAAIAQDSPDAVIVDAICWGAGSLAETTGLPWAWAAVFPVAIESADLPPRGLGLTPGTGPFYALRDAAVRTAATVFWRPTLAELNELRTSLGTSPVRSMTELWTRRAALTAIYMAEPLEYPRTDWPETVRLVGPGVWSPPSATPPWLERLDRLGKPLILVSCSTERQRDDALAGVALRALSSLDVSVVVTTGAAGPVAGPVPDNARVEQFVPHGLLIERAACVVCPGGMGTVHAALAAGVPVVTVPFGRDQPEVARRVEMAGVGVRLPASRLDPARLRAAVIKAMTLRENAAAVGKAIRAAGGPAVAADVTEHLTDVPVG